MHELAARAPERINTDVLAALRFGRERPGRAPATTNTWRWRPLTVLLWMPLLRLQIHCGVTSSATR